VIELTRHDAQKNDILVHTTFFDAQKPQTLGDQAQLEQVFLNLVMNAIEAMSSSKSDRRILELKTGVDEDGKIFVTVADNGPGVEMEDLERFLKRSSRQSLWDGMGYRFAARLSNPMGATGVARESRS
jgi:C4-dicarboxylate-specific signal transduction histidine kinase